MYSFAPTHVIKNKHASNQFIAGARVETCMILQTAVVIFVKVLIATGRPPEAYVIKLF
jgi:hypothetical protein